MNENSNEETPSEDEKGSRELPKREYLMRKEMVVNVKTLLELSPQEGAKTWERFVETILEFRFREERDTSEEDDATLDVILKMLIFKVDVALRKKVSERLAEIAEAPEELVILLAKDESAVAQPVLSRCAAFSEQTLISIIRQHTEAHRRAICDRTELTPPLIDALIENGQESVLKALVEKEGISFSRENISTLVDKSRHFDEIRLSLLRHKDMTHVQAYRLFWWASQEERQYILENYDLDPDRLGHILIDVIEGGGDDKGKDSVLKSTISIVDNAQWMRQLDFSLLYTDGMQQFLNALVSHLELSGDLVRRTLLDKGHEPLALLCRAMGVSLENYLSLAKHLNISLISQPGAGDEYSDLNAIFHDMSPVQAAIVIAIWQLNGLREQQSNTPPPAIAA